MLLNIKMEGDDDGGVSLERVKWISIGLPMLSVRVTLKSLSRSRRLIYDRTISTTFRSCSKKTNMQIVLGVSRTKEALGSVSISVRPRPSIFLRSSERLTPSR